MRHRWSTMGLNNALRARITLPSLRHSPPTLKEVRRPRPLCRVPSSSPDPRSSRSHSATTKPLLCRSSTWGGRRGAGGKAMCVERDSRQSCTHASEHRKGALWLSLAGSSTHAQCWAEDIPRHPPSSSAAHRPRHRTPGSSRTGGCCAPRGPAAGAAAQSQSALQGPGQGTGGKIGGL